MRGLFSRPARLGQLKRGLPAGAYTDPAAIPPPGASGGRLAAGLVLDERTALQISTVMSCVRELGGDISGLVLEEQQYDGRRWRLVPPHQMSPIVADPFAGCDPVVGWFQIMASLLLRGNAWSKVVDRDRLQRPTRVLPVHPDSVRPRIVGGRRTLTLGREPIDLDDVVHVPGFVMPGGWTGLDPIQFHAQALGLALATETYGAQYFANGTVVAGVLQSDQPLTEDQVRRTLQLWRKRHGGLSNAHLPAVLGNGLKWQAMTVAPNEAQFLETRDYQRHEIAGIFGVPPERVGAVGKNASQGGAGGGAIRDLSYAKHTVRPWVLRLETAWSRLLPADRRVRFNLDDLLRGDPASRASFYASGRAGGWLLIDEIRDREDLDPLPDGQGGNPFTPLNSAQSDGNTTGTGEPRSTKEETP